MDAKQELINKYAAAVNDIAQLFLTVPVDVEKFNFAPENETLVLHELIKYLQQIELACARGIASGNWDTESIPWYVGKNQAMVDQLQANHREALNYLEQQDKEDFISRTVEAPFANGSLAHVLGVALDDLKQHTEKLSRYLQLLKQ